jgi:Lipase (class 3)
MAIPYDATRLALLHPEAGATVLQAGLPPAIDRLCAEVSRLAYKPVEHDPNVRAEVAAIFAGIGFGRFESLNVADTQALLVGSQNTTIVAFRGTEQKVGDFATDLDALKVDWPQGGQVHAGFAHALAVARPTLDGWLKGAQAPVYFTGHSLGAALATLAATLYPTAALYTFGSPLVGDADFVAACKFDAHRHVDCCDLVTRVPPEALGFQHVGALQYIDRAGNLRGNADAPTIADDRSEAREEYLLKVAWRPGTVPVRDLADHAPINYVSAVWQMRAP